MNYIIYDIIIAAVLLFFLWRGYCKGFVLTLCSLLAVFVALIGASVLSNALAEPAAKAVEPVVAARIQESLAEAIQNTEFVSVDGGVAEKPEEIALAGVIQHLKETELFQGFADAFQKAVDSGVAEVTANAAQALAHFAAVQIARGGGAVGLVKGALIVYIAVWLLRGSYIPPAAIEGSYLLRFFASASPLSFFL